MLNWDKTEQINSLKQHFSKFSLYSTGMFTTNLSISEPKEFYCFHRQHRISEQTLKFLMTLIEWCQGYKRATRKIAAKNR